MPLSFQQKN